MTKKTKSWIEAELEDTLDEMFEEEFNAPALTEEMRKASHVVSLIHVQRSSSTYKTCFALKLKRSRVR